MNIVKCANGHFYDADSYKKCPHCDNEMFSEDMSTIHAPADRIYDDKTVPLYSDGEDEKTLPGNMFVGEDHYDEPYREDYEWKDRGGFAGDYYPDDGEGTIPADYDGDGTIPMDGRAISSLEADVRSAMNPDPIPPSEYDATIPAQVDLSPDSFYGGGKGADMGDGMVYPDPEPERPAETFAGPDQGPENIYVPGYEPEGQSRLTISPSFNRPKASSWPADHGEKSIDFEAERLNVETDYKPFDQAFHTANLDGSHQSEGEEEEKDEFEEDDFLEFDDEEIPEYDDEVIPADEDEMVPEYEDEPAGESEDPIEEDKAEEIEPEEIEIRPEESASDLFVMEDPDENTSDHVVESEGENSDGSISGESGDIYWETPPERLPDTDEDDLILIRENRDGDALIKENGPVEESDEKAADSDIFVDDLERTIVYEESDKRIAGWLVCVAGSQYGQSQEILTGANRINQWYDQDSLVLTHQDESETVDHAFIIFDPSECQFRIQVGLSGLMVYVNDQLVLTPRLLKDRDRISLGQGEYIFAAFCDDRFSWE